jgi:adenine-specific DNA-methyltransferase
VIDEFYNDEKLVRAMCKLLGYTFRPSHDDYFRHGVGTGQNYLYVTTQMMSSALVRQIASHLGEHESLVIATKKYELGTESVDPRITIRKIPQSVLKACQYGKKEYLLPIRESAIEEVEYDDSEEDEVTN